jgi:aspartokinase
MVAGYESGIVGIKAGSSIFHDESCFDSVADLIVPLTQQADQIFFVVSALKGETDRTIDDIAGADREVLNAALQGNPSPASARYNTTDIAAQLVTPEGYSVRQLTAALQARGIRVIGLQHGPTYPLIGIDNNNFLYATPDLDASQRHMPRYDAQVVVVPGFGVRNARGEVMCTGRGSSDLTLAQFGVIFDLNEIVYWKDSGGYLRDPNDRSKGVYKRISREQVEVEGAKVLDRRVLKTYAPGIRITDAGKISGGTIIAPYQKATRAQHLYEAVAAK